MNFSETLHNTYHILSANKTRSILTMLGIIIGITGVIVIISAGNGAQSLISNQIKSQGSNLVAIFPGNGEDEGPPVSVMGIVITSLKYDDVKALKNAVRAPDILDYTAYVRGSVDASWQGNKANTSYVGVSASLPFIEDTGAQSGAFFTEDDENGLQKVAVLGADVKNDLFGDQDPIGELVKIGKHSFRVVGVMRERGTAGFTNQDNQIYVPVTTAQKLLSGINYVNFARVKVSDETQIDSAMDDIREILRERHNLDIGASADFDVRSQKDALDALLKVTNAVKFFLVAVAAVALLVGGIGIMNIMLVSVQERIREIGLRKAVGAQSRQILSQFLVETVVITSLAGIVGIVLGIFISYLLSLIVQSLNYDWTFSISVFSVLLSVSVSSIIGFIFGLVPARRASQLDPIEALRYE
ncbi:MAG: ABC transporter permease [Candidatus Magasanikbacteria bacterium]|nr:ABC transporter permease [Candidatus Magasanikbacteria bacterium]